MPRPRTTVISCFVEDFRIMELSSWRREGSANNTSFAERKVRGLGSRAQGRFARICKDHIAEIKPKKSKQKLSTLLLSKLANVDSKDIRQTIDVKHHNEEIFGDINFIHADGAKTQSRNTSNFDSVSENVELTVQHGKAYVIIKVIAERIIPTDLEFNVWRKSQAIVTRQIEIDLLANEQRRRFYNHIMDTQGRPASDDVDHRGHHGSRFDLKERQLNSVETLKLFSQILDVADGQGEKEHTSMRTKQEMGQLDSGMLY